jgi:hypothetical protein
MGRESVAQYTGAGIIQSGRRRVSYNKTTAVESRNPIPVRTT